MTSKQLDEVREWIINNIILNEDIMFSDEIRNGKIDLIEVIDALYELLHREVTGKSYDYMYHQANKIGAWVEHDKIITEMMAGRIKDD